MPSDGSTASAMSETKEAIEMGKYHETDNVFMSPEELMRYLKIGRTKCYELLAQGDIPSYKIGTLRRIRLADVEQCLEAKKYRAGE